MQTVKASVLLDDAYRLMRWDPAALEESEKADGRAALSLALQEVWDAWWWSRLMKCEQMAFARVWPQTGVPAFAPGDLCYFPPTRKYYQALIDFYPNSSTSPAFLISGAWVLNTQAWAECQTVYTGADYDAMATYVQGDTVRDPFSDTYYKYLGMGIQVVGAGSPGTDNFYGQRAVLNGKPYYSAYTGTGLLYWDAGTGWNLLPGAGVRYRSAEDVATPDLVTTWLVEDFAVAPAPSVLAVQFPPPDTLCWALVTPFQPTLTVAGSVRIISQNNPLSTDNPGAVEFEELLDTTEVYGLTENRPWVWYRRPTPVITGDEFSTTTIYEATDSQELVYDV
jgi:hypothetical protein